jgi:integral membrane protein
MSTAPGRPALDETKARAAFSRYRVMAFVTGGFLLLLSLEMLLKYVLQVNGLAVPGDIASARPVLGDWIAIVHGWIYVIYLITVVDLWSRMRWGFGRILALIAGGVIPVLSFVMERRAHRWFDVTLVQRRG